MSRMRKRLLGDFLVPALDSEKYGTKLQWIDRKRGTFRILWSHKNAAGWGTGDTEVFQDWDRLKGHYRPELIGYHMAAKQRFRAALYKLNKEVIHLKDIKVKHYRDYQLTFNFRNKKKSNNLAKPKIKTPKSSDESAVRKTVICENTSYKAKPASEDQRPASPDLYTPSDLQILAQYSCYMKKMKLKMKQYENLVPVESSQKNPREVHEYVLRENSSFPKISHIAPQPVPVYCSYKQYNSRPHSLQEFPEVFVSKIYNGPENVPEKKDDTRCSDCPIDDDVVPGILNLSLK